MVRIQASRPQSPSLSTFDAFSVIVLKSRPHHASRLRFASSCSSDPSWGITAVSLGFLRCIARLALLCLVRLRRLVRSAARVPRLVDPFQELQR